MEQKQVFKQMIDFNKTAFDSSFNAIAALQDQTESISNTFFNQATWLPGEGRKAIDEWVKTCKAGRETFKKSMDESCKKVEDYL